ncbi:unnamed protein product, partial [Staurois parvus]
WYKAVVNSSVPCDLCDHSQISHVVSNVRSEILLTTIHVITDWPISDHMIGTSHRGPVQRSVSGGHSGHRIMVLSAPRECAQPENVGAIYERQPAPALLPFQTLHGPDRKWL